MKKIYNLGARFSQHAAQLLADCTTIFTFILVTHGRIQRGGHGVRNPPPLKNHKNIGFLSNTGPVPLKNQASIQCWSIISPPAKHHLNGILLAGRCWPTFSGILILSPSLSEEKNVRVGPPLAKLSESAHETILTAAFCTALDGAPPPVVSVWADFNQLAAAWLLLISGSLDFGCNPAPTEVRLGSGVITTD